MKLTVKQIVKKDKNVGGMTQTMYSCVLKGYAFFPGTDPDPKIPGFVEGKLVLESESQEALKNIVRPVIDAEVDIDFSQAQQTFDAFDKQAKEKQNLASGIKNQTNFIDTFGIEGAKQVVEAAKEIISGKHGRKTYKVNVGDAQ